MYDKTVDALIALLVQKGVITEKELRNAMFNIHEISRLSRELAYKDR